MADIEALLAAIAADTPCGPDLALTYDAQFVALETAARGKQEQQLGDHISPAEQPDWGAVRQQAESLLMRSKDVRIAVLLARALVRVDNLPGLRDGLRLLHGLIERYWPILHPVDPDEPDDFTIRLNALAPLGDANALLLDVRSALVVVSGPHGRVSVRDILVAAGRLPPAKGETVLSQAQIESAIAAAAAQDRERIDAARDSADLVPKIYSLLSDRVGTDLATDLRPLSSMLKLIVQACDNATPQTSEVILHRVADSRVDPAGQAGSATALVSEIGSRDDAMRALDAVCKFYERAEPGNPAPLLIRRAQRLINKSFVEIMQDLAPDSLSQIRNIAGLKDE
ncbi:type VI secretion system protein TssA [Polaromonas glacialis]|uniref:type VI secretion system protein TssA n=1 Tax=Polaromonas glacialis TaxID=866564 RepID=UPI000498339F|nr:type VI secretion system protein TssA [Polaromonas glacialis]